RRMFEKAALEHPIDFVVELGCGIALYARQFRQQPFAAQLGLEVAQKLRSGASLVLAQPGNGAVERAPDLLSRLLIDLLAGDNAAAPAQIGDLAAARLQRPAHQRLHQGGCFVTTAQHRVEAVVGVFELNFVEWHAGRLHRFNGRVERARMPGDGNRNVTQVGERAHWRVRTNQNGSCTDRGIEPDDPAFSELLHPFDRTPLAHGINFKRPLLQLAFLPALGEILHAAFRSLRVVLVVDDLDAFIGKKSLLYCNTPGPVMSIAVALHANGFAHGTSFKALFSLPSTHCCRIMLQKPISWNSEWPSCSVAAIAGLRSHRLRSATAPQSCSVSIAI